MNRTKTEALGIDALKNLVSEIVKATKAISDGFQQDDIKTYFDAVMTAARDYKAASAELQDLDAREGLLLTEHISAEVRETFFPEN